MLRGVNNKLYLTFFFTGGWGGSFVLLYVCRAVYILYLFFRVHFLNCLWFQNTAGLGLKFRSAWSEAGNPRSRFTKARWFTFPKLFTLLLHAFLCIVDNRCNKPVNAGFAGLGFSPDQDMYYVCMYVCVYWYVKAFEKVSLLSSFCWSR